MEVSLLAPVGNDQLGVRRFSPDSNIPTEITRVFLLTEVSKKTPYYSVFVKSYLKSYKKNWTPHFCEVQFFLTK